MRETSDVTVGKGGAMEGLCDLARCSFEECRSAKGHVEGACEVEFAVIVEGIRAMDFCAQHQHGAACLCATCVPQQKPLVALEDLEALVRWIL